MITQKTKDEALKLFQRIETAAAPLAVFVNRTNGTIRATKITTDLFRQAYRSSFRACMGVYDYNVRLEWLEQDLELMGVQ